MTKPCIKTTRALNKDGYGVLFKDKYGYGTEHRYVYAKHHGIALGSKDVVRHTCDHPWCIEITHLVLGTQTDNVRDSVERGRHKNPSFLGSKNPMALLDEDEVEEIRDLFSYGWTHKELAAEFKVNRITILNIVNGKTWKGDISRDS